MADPTLRPMPQTDQTQALARAAEKLGVPVSPSDEARVERVALAIGCLVEDRGACWPPKRMCRCWDAAEAAISALAPNELSVPPIELMVGPFRLRHVDGARLEIMRDGEGGDFSTAELSEVIGRFVSERL